MGSPRIDQQITFLYTSDLSNTLFFYQDLLGLKLILDQGRCLIFQICSSGFLGFCEKHQLESTNDSIVTFVVDNVDEWYEFLLEQNIDIEVPPKYNHEYNIYHLFFYDPNGYLVEIQKFMDPDWLQNT